MKSESWKNKIKEYMREHRLRKRWLKITASLGALAIIATAAAMILPAITMENAAQVLECQIDIHTHTDSCYDAEGNIICGYADFVVHTHNASCYAEDGTLICPLDEIEAHTHTDACYEIPGELICGKEEIILHTHTADCLDENGKVVCGMLEVKEHVHDENCRPISSAGSNGGIQAESVGRSVDFTDMITDITLQVQEGGYWVDLIGGTVEEGASVRVRIEFTVKGGTLSGEDRTMHYQLPDGIRLREQEQGQVDYNDGDPAGTYTIDTDGYIEIIFDSSFPVEQDFSGYLQFEGTVAMLEGEESGTIDFGGEGGSITIVPEEKEMDLSIAKTGTYDKTTGKVLYTITVSSVNGTNGEAVHIGDWFQHEVSYGLILYDQDSLIIKKLKDGAGENISLEEAEIVLHQQDGESAGWWNIRNLPPLAPGEAYQITYSATPDLENSGDSDGYLEFVNVAAAQSGGKTVDTSAKVVISQGFIRKVVESYNPYDRSITWTIYVRNPDGRDLAGESLEDLMTFVPAGAGGAAWNEPPANVTVTVGIYEPEDVNFNVEIGQIILEDVSFPFIFPENSVYSYSLTYTTVLPEELAGQTGYFNNWAQFLGYEANAGTAIEIPGLTDYGITKSSWGDKEITDADGDTVTALTWGLVVTYPADADPGDLVYVDLIADAVTEDGSAIPESHYTTPEALGTDGIIVVPLVGNEWGEPLMAGTDYTVYVLLKEDQPSWVTPENFGEADMTALQGLEWLTYYEVESMVKNGTISETTPISMLAVELTPSGFAKLAGSPMVVQYSTVLDTGKIPDGAAVLAHNLARIPTNWTYASYEKKSMDKLDKQVSFTGPGATGDVSSYGDTAQGTIGTDGIIYYRLLLSDFMEDGTGGVTVTDVLPAGAKLIEGSVYLAAHDQAADMAQEGQVWSDYYIQYSTAPGDNGTTEVTFMLSRLNNLQDADILGICYAVSVADDPVWNSQESKDYVNTATWDGETDSTTTTVTHKLPVLKKTGNQLTLEDGSPDNVVRYYVVVNPDGEQLMDEEGRTLTLTDTLTVPDGAAAQLLLETAGVYHYDPEKEHGIGAPLAEEEYTIQYDGKTHVLTVEIPDATACVVVYDYKINRGESDIVDLTVNNNAMLEGSAATGSDFNIVIEEQSSIAGVNTANLIIYKVNRENNAELLNGALFRLERYTEQAQGGYEWEQTSITAVGPDGQFVTGDDGPTGQIILSFLEGEGNTRYDTIYRLQETQAPPGYEITDHDYCYFVWMKENTTKQQTIANMAAVFEETAIDPEEVYFIPYNANYSLYIENEPLTTSIRVAKQWRSETGQPLTENLPESITLTLYQHLNGETVQYGDSVIIQADENGNWAYTWEGLPKKGEDGGEYTYTVQETPVSGYEASYVYPENTDKETGIAGGNITIINSRSSSYILPETGGDGPAMFVIPGLLLGGASGAGYLLYVRRNRRRERGGA